MLKKLKQKQIAQSTTFLVPTKLNSHFAYAKVFSFSSSAQHTRNVFNVTNTLLFLHSFGELFATETVSTHYMTCNLRQALDQTCLLFSADLFPRD